MGNERELPETVTVEAIAAGHAAQVQPRLKLVAGADPRDLFLEPGHTYTLGRATGCELCFAAEGLSRRHAKLTVDRAGTVTAVDLGSHNGTFVDGQRIDAVVLREGSTLRVGGLSFRFDLAHPPATDPAGASDLSKRELEVARLVAQGLSNEEVGRRLHISPRTVSAHLTRIYDRLGFRTRAALTRYVVDHGLA